uniref:Uncharacterized protein n=1 Tax=Aegilops tauschii subsp. strangulata TaxID=200361 RepID=A0A453AR03_AEGTS
MVYDKTVDCTQCLWKPCLKNHYIFVHEWSMFLRGNTRLGVICFLAMYLNSEMHFSRC